MILAVCLNPALDVTYTVAGLSPGTSHRVQSVHRRAGGKGINVASVLHRQGIEVTVTGVAGGRVGDDLRERLNIAGIRHHLSPVAADTRQTFTVLSQTGATVFNEPGPQLDTAEWAGFVADFARLARSAAVVTLSGSLPPGSPADAYGRLIAISHAAGARVILDCDGDALIEALHTAPDIVKINEHEAADSTGADTGTLEGVFAAAEQLHVLGAVEVVITRGAAGAAARTATGRLTARGADQVRGNPTGAGDAFTAGLAASPDLGRDWPTTLRRACGWAAGAVATATAGDLDCTVAAAHETRTTIQEVPS